MKKEHVESSNLDWVAYDEDNNELYVAFKSGGEYVYYDVAKEIYDGLLAAESKGRYHAINIKWKYKYKRVN